MDLVVDVINVYTLSPNKYRLHYIKRRISNSKRFVKPPSIPQKLEIVKSMKSKHNFKFAIVNRKSDWNEFQLNLIVILKIYFSLHLTY